MISWPCCLVPKVRQHTGVGIRDRRSSIYHVQLERRDRKWLGSHYPPQKYIPSLPRAQPNITPLASVKGPDKSHYPSRPLMWPCCPHFRPEFLSDCPNLFSTSRFTPSIFLVQSSWFILFYYKVANISPNIIYNLALWYIKLFQGFSSDL